MSDKSLQLSQPKLLIGEGNEEVLFFRALLKHLQITDVQVEQYGGKQGLGTFLKQLYLITSGYQNLVSLGITRDADDSAKNAFESVCGFLKNNNLPLPKKPQEIVGDKPKISVLIIPDYQDSGMLEDICLEAVKTDSAIQCIDEFFKCVSSQVGRIPGEMNKARLRVWLASQIKPDLRLGEAAQKGYFDWDSPAFEGLKQFLQNL
jgi:hypothetical protein